MTTLRPPSSGDSRRDRAADAFDDQPHDREPEARAGHVLVGGAAPEPVGRAFELIGLQAGTVVRDEEPDDAAVLAGVDHDERALRG